MHILCPSQYQKLKSVKDDGSNRESRRSKEGLLSSTVTDLFPILCFSCKQWKRVIKGTPYFPYIVSTTNAQHNLRTAAGIHGNTELLTKIGDYNLTAKEFMMHKPCYNDNVRRKVVTVVMSKMTMVTLKQ